MLPLEQWTFFTMSAMLLFDPHKVMNASICHTHFQNLLSKLVTYNLQLKINISLLWSQSQKRIHISLFRSLQQLLKLFCLSHCDVMKCAVMSKTFVTRLAEPCPAQCSLDQPVFITSWCEGCKPCLVPRLTALHSLGRTMQPSQHDVAKTVLARLQHTPCCSWQACVMTCFLWPVNKRALYHYFRAVRVN